MLFEQYEHHGKEMWVRNDLKGKHRDYCLCHKCKKLNIEDRDKNCPIASLLYRLDILANVTTPVWECMEFDYKGEGN